MGQTCLAVPGPGLPENDVHRGAPAGRTTGEAHRQGRRVGDRCAPAFRHLGLRLGAVRIEATRRIASTGRLTGVDALGVDEHVWSHTGPPGTGMVTGIVDHTRDPAGVVHARLLDLVPGRSGKAYADWLKELGFHTFVSFMGDTNRERSNTGTMRRRLQS